MNSPILAVGLGGGGSRLIPDTCRVLEADGIVVSTDGRDEVGGYPMLTVPSGSLVNRSVYQIRGSSADTLESFSGLVSGYGTVILLANLAGRTGAALAPQIAAICRSAGAKVVTVAIMPFRYEKDRLFQAALSLRRVQDMSDSTIIFDNDSMLECHPEMSPRQCYEAGNTTILQVLDRLDSTSLSKVCVVAAGMGVADPLRTSVKMLYGTVQPRAVSHSILYVSNDSPTGDIESVIQTMEGVTDAPVEVAGVDTSGREVVLVAATRPLSKFERYDPLFNLPLIASDNEPDLAVDFDDMGMYSLE